MGRLKHSPNSPWRKGPHCDTVKAMVNWKNDPDPVVDEATEILAAVQRRKRKGRYSVWWGMGRFRMVATGETHPYHDQHWRLVGLYTPKATVEMLREDIEAWKQQYLK